MSLQSLLMAGAERVATAFMATIPWRQDSAGQWRRATISNTHRTAIRQRMEEIVSRTLSGPERTQLNTLVDAADHATRLAHRTMTDGRQLPSASEVQRLPGTANRGGSDFRYRTSVEYIDPQTGERGSVTHTVVSREILTGDQVHARVVQAFAQGDLIPDQGTDGYSAAGRLIQRVNIISLYQGAFSI